MKPEVEALKEGRAKSVGTDYLVKIKNSSDEDLDTLHKLYPNNRFLKTELKKRASMRR